MAGERVELLCIHCGELMGQSHINKGMKSRSKEEKDLYATLVRAHSSVAKKSPF